MRKRESLIPSEKTKKVIRLDRRGQVKKKRSAGAAIWGVLGILCLLYCLCIALFMGFGTYFFLIWGVLAVFCGIISLFLAHKNWVAKIPKWLRIIFIIIFVMGLLLFGTVEAVIL